MHWQTKEYCQNVSVKCYRFREDDNWRLEDIIEQSLPELEEKVRKFYDGIDGVDFNLSVEDVATNYRNTMM